MRNSKNTPSKGTGSRLGICYFIEHPWAMTTLARMQSTLHAHSTPAKKSPISAPIKNACCLYVPNA
jgi:hypothetical protein